MCARSLLGFDFGTRKIGVAVGQELTASARPLCSVRSVAGKPDWSTLTQLLDEWRPDALVVGIPLNMDDSEQPMTAAARRFVRQLEQRYKIPVYSVDERLTSIEATRIYTASGKSVRSGKRGKVTDKIDPIAAQLILETWLLHQQNNHRAPAP
ncbi:MAG: Holliday junction resolvase RuvX [Gammaproteobacteria bacterium]|nr:Holliday junction resolvase RuvX [Gammaproteobacteria bacterium]